MASKKSNTEIVKMLKAGEITNAEALKMLGRSTHSATCSRCGGPVSDGRKTCGEC